MLKQHELKPKLKRKRRKVLGRGDSSGHGSYSTKGAKGQSARSGVSGLKLLGMRHIILSTPKLKGFQSRHAKPETIKLGQLDKNFNDGDTADRKTLFDKELVRTAEADVKIISGGTLSKKLIIKGCKVSSGAKAAIEKAGGKVE